MLDKVDDVSIVESIDDNSVVAISGFNMATTPEYLSLNRLLLNSARKNPGPNRIMTAPPVKTS